MHAISNASGVWGRRPLQGSQSCAREDGGARMLCAVEITPPATPVAHVEKSAVQAVPEAHRPAA